MNGAKGTYPSPPAPTYSYTDGGPYLNERAPKGLSLSRARSLAQQCARQQAGTGKVYWVVDSQGRRQAGYTGVLSGKGATIARRVAD